MDGGDLSWKAEFAQLNDDDEYDLSDLSKTSSCDYSNVLRSVYDYALFSKVIMVGCSFQENLAFFSNLVTAASRFHRCFLDIVIPVI